MNPNNAFHIIIYIGLHYRYSYTEVTYVRGFQKKRYP